MNKKLFALALTGCAAFGQNLITLDIGSTAASFNGSGSGIATYRIEFRLENVQPSRAVLSNGSGSGNLNCAIGSGLQLQCSQGGDGTPQGIPFRILTSGQDVRVRFQRNSVGPTYTLETWTGACTNYASQQLSVISAGSLPQASTWTFGPSVNVSFVRGYSTLDTAGDCPVDAPVAAADLYDFTFEGNSLSDRSAHHYQMSAPGGTFVNSATYSPHAVISGLTTPKPVARATSGVTLGGSASVSFGYPGTGAVTSYFWQQLAGPAQSSFSARNGPTVVVTAPVAGQYTYQLTVGDSSGNTASATQTLGMVAADANNIVIEPNPGFAIALGNPLMHGASPWPWYEATEAADVDLLAGLMETPPNETAGPGTCTIPSGSPNQLSGGRITASTYGGVAVVCSGANFTPADAGTRIALNWDADGDGSYKGRYSTYVNQYVSSNVVVVNQYFITEPPASFANGLNWGRVDSTYAPYNAGDGNSFILMFYEAGLAVGRMYQKTGLTTYQTQFHAFCDNWWRWALDSGFTPGIPRNEGLNTMIACAADPTYTVPPGMWSGIANLIQLSAPALATAGGSTPGYNPTADGVPGLQDPRENSYILRFSALMARLYGAHGGSTSTWCGYLANQVTHIWLPISATPTGYSSSTYSFYPENLFYGNVTEPSSGNPALTGPFGTSPWRSNGLPAAALGYAWDALNDPATCDNPSLAATLLNTTAGTGLIPRIVNYIRDFGRSADGGILAAASYPNWTNGEGGWDPSYGSNFFVYNSGNLVNGSVSLTNGGTTVTGSNTSFIRQFPPGTVASLNGTTATVQSVASNTSMTLTAGYAGSTASGVTNFGNNGTITVTNGSTSIVGSGTGFLTTFAPCNGTTFIGVYNPSVNADRYVAQVTACADNTHLTINAPYPGTTTAGLGTFLANGAAQSNCGPMSITTLCNADYYDGRNLSMDVGASATWLYKRTGSNAWNSLATYYYDKMFGGAAAGAGAIGTPTGAQPAYLPGTITATASSASIVGAGTSFLTQFACNGTDSITIGDATGGYTWATVSNINTPVFYTVQVDSCADNTHLTLHSAYPGSGAAATGVFYNAVDPNWQGPDGDVGNLGEILPVCGSSNPPPCGIGDLVPKYGKPLGMASGAGNVPVAMADRKGGPASPMNRTLAVAFNLGSVPNATQVAVALTYPDGTNVTNTCSASPCSVVGDARESGALLVVQYLTSGGAVLARSSQPAFIQVQ